MQKEYGMAIEPVGVESSAEFAMQAHKKLQAVGGNCIQQDAINAIDTLDDETIDLIILSSTLQTEMNPMMLLRKIHNKLRPHGKILLDVPNYDCNNRKQLQNKWSGFRYPDNVNYFVPRTLKAMLHKAGLCCEWLKAEPDYDNMYAVASMKKQ